MSADYREIFGRDPEPWREPLGALRLTLAGDDPWTLERARAECEALVKVLNETAVRRAQSPSPSEVTDDGQRPKERSDGRAD